MDLFNGKTDTDDEFPEPFLATGKTERDYGTLIKSAHKVAAEIRIQHQITKNLVNYHPTSTG